MHLSHGTAYDVMRPELLLLGCRSLVPGLAGRPDGTLYERSFDVDLLHIVRMEPIEAGTQREHGDN